MAPKTSKSEDAPKPKASKNEVKQQKNDDRSELIAAIKEDFKNIGIKIDRLEKLDKELNRKKVPKPLHPINVPEALGKFITNAIKNNKLSPEIMTKHSFNSKTVITNKDKIDRNQVSTILWDYIKKNCKSTKDTKGKPIYTCDADLEKLIEVDEFKLTNFQTYFSALYPKKSKSEESSESSDSEDSDSESSESSSDSDSEEEEEEVKPVAKGKKAPASVKKSK